MRFELVKSPAYGFFGWNNSMAGTFVYSPRVNDAEEDRFTFRGTRWRDSSLLRFSTPRPQLTAFRMARAATNRYGESNWAEVVIKIKHTSVPSQSLKMIILGMMTMVVASLCGLVRQVRPEKRATSTSGRQHYAVFYSVWGGSEGAAERG